MSKYGWGWLWKSKLSPLGLMFRLFGYVPPEDESTDPDQISWRLTVIPVYGFGAKELVATANKMFGKYFDKDDIAQSVKDFLEAKQNGDWYDIVEHFSFEVSPEERESVLRGLGNSKSWKVEYDEYKSVQDEAEWQWNFHQNRVKLHHHLEVLTKRIEEQGYPTKEALAEKIRKDTRGEDDDDEVFE